MVLLSEEIPPRWYRNQMIRVGLTREERHKDSDSFQDSAKDLFILLLLKKKRSEGAFACEYD